MCRNGQYACCVAGSAPRHPSASFSSAQLPFGSAASAGSTSHRTRANRLYNSSEAAPEGYSNADQSVSFAVMFLVCVPVCDCRNVPFCRSADHRPQRMDLDGRQRYGQSARSVRLAGDSRGREYSVEPNHACDRNRQPGKSLALWRLGIERCFAQRSLGIQSVHQSVGLGEWKQYRNCAPPDLRTNFTSSPSNCLARASASVFSLAERRTAAAFICSMTVLLADGSFNRQFSTAAENSAHIPRRPSPLRRGCPAWHVFLKMTSMDNSVSQVWSLVARRWVFAK